MRIGDLDSGRYRRSGATPAPPEKYQKKVEWLRAAAKEGFDAMDRGDYYEFKTPEELRDFMQKVYEEALELHEAGRPDESAAWVAVPHQHGAERPDFYPEAKRRSVRRRCG